MTPFDYVEPETLDETLALLAEHGDDATIIAGGTALTLLLKQGLIAPARLVSLRRLDQLRAIDRDGTLRIGALATHATAARSVDVQEHAAALAHTFSGVATPRIRAQATVGGNLAHADPAQDPPVTLLALDAVAIAMSAKRARRIPLGELFVDLMETSLEPDEVLLRIEVPPLPHGARTVYRKFLPRTQDDYATVSVAAVIARNATGTCTHARVALGAAGPVPIRAREAERALVGTTLDDGAIREAAALAAKATDPIDDLRGSALYKRAMAEVWTARALRDIA
ncbi:MAG TPA: xanthine dehydrogenase family protein subunit M [Candidatus Limnocylindria bacterium]|nr:xanthine dehydrogenase family protein subunit M [Candidatus Limnocylindria bacterium]